MTERQWWVRSQPLRHRTGSDIFQHLYGALLQQPPTASTVVALLESPYPLPAAAQPHAIHSRYSICAGPPRHLDGVTQVWTPTVGHILPALTERLATAHQICLLGDEAEVAEQTLPFTGGWLGWLGYDFAWEIERLPTLNTDPLPFPVALWYEPATFAVLDHQAQRLWLAAPTPTEAEAMEQGLARPSAEVFWPPVTQGSHGLTLAMTAAEYQQAVLQAKQHIQAGDVFQVNLSLRFSTTTTTHSWSLYRRLQHINPSPFACYWRTPWGSVISCSPERLIKLQDGTAQTRPIAGTRPRGSTPEQDAELAQTLLSNPKERAEHIMLVDLERNDLGRVCQWGTVQVDELLTVEYYSHVMHLVSNVVGQLQGDCRSGRLRPRTAIDLIRATFPGGTITGCPKVRCMEIIEALEPVRRSLFYGSCGYLDRRGYLDLNILIRTLLFGHTDDSSPAVSTVWGQVGAGIVADSDPLREWQESLQKAKAQLLALGLG
ncbi:anthranilate synthase component I [Nodosilinea sp. LEGE 07088]|uniref:anthranilate synthase component I n=1 Tax=Nodosilinea sp. LEGE 07088 TaxID=2777968 RepID=UPI0018813F83|nr:anthranilate synthase component I [Nodosilinea sp. LEGE 07088]MBE9139078.1 anthranilate synthase component I [Nodosilinea sp. LEGE 07088]